MQKAHLTARMVGLTTLLVASVGAQQNCVYVPDSNPSTGTLDTKPFGDVDPTDPAKANHHLLIRVPKSYFPNQKVTIREIGFAAASSGIRNLDRVSVSLGTIPDTQALVPTFWMNSPGFSATPVNGVVDWDWNTTAGLWSYLGWDSTFPYDPTQGVDLIIEITVRGGGLPGTADPSFYSDPNLDHVYASGFTTNLPSTGTVGKGAPKLEICFDLAASDAYGRGCPGSNGTPTLSFTGSARAGMNLNMQVGNGPTANTSMMMTIGRLGSSITDLTPYGMPGCRNYPIWSVISVLPLNGGSASLPMTMPNYPSAIGAVYWFQFFIYDPPANTLGFSATPVARVMVGS